MIEPITPAQFENELAIRQAKAARHYAITQNECYWLFWNRSVQDILDSMNANVALTMERFLANTSLGGAVNDQLEKTPYVERCITAMPSGYGFDGQQFTYTTPE